MTARASDSMFYPLTLCALQIVFMIMIIMIMTFSFQRLSDFVKQVYYIPDYARLGRVLQRPPKESFIDW